MIRVLFSIQSHYTVNRKLLKSKIGEALSGKVHRDCEVSVSVIGDRQMRTLNRTYRNLDKTTDVLSFPLTEHLKDAPIFIDHPDDVLRLGDIIVSYPQAIKEATEENVLVDDKMIELVLHGLNHLLGIHHPE